MTVNYSMFSNEEDFDDALKAIVEVFMRRDLLYEAIISLLLAALG